MHLREEGAVGVGLQLDDVVRLLFAVDVPLAGQVHVSERPGPDGFAQNPFAVPHIVENNSCSDNIINNMFLNHSTHE